MSSAQRSLHSRRCISCCSMYSCLSLLLVWHSIKYCCKKVLLLAIEAPYRIPTAAAAAAASNRVENKEQNRRVLHADHRKHSRVMQKEFDSNMLDGEVVRIQLYLLFLGNSHSILGQVFPGMYSEKAKTNAGLLYSYVYLYCRATYSSQYIIMTPTSYLSHSPGC